MDIETLVVELSKDPFNPSLNFKVAVEYERLNQTASAVSFYLRTAEYGGLTEDPLVYTSLIKMAICFENQKDRQYTVTNHLLQAIAYWPQRPEAWFLLAQYHEKSGNWQEAYTFAKSGLSCENFATLPAQVGYFGTYCLLFEIAVCAYWIGRKKESVRVFEYLAGLQLEPAYESAVQDNLRRLHASV